MGNINCFWDLCLGCRQCESACSVAHSLTKSLFGAINEPSKSRSRIVSRVDRFKSNIGQKCHNCNPAPCTDYCSCGALKRDGKSGIMIIDNENCTGCGGCVVGCPFGAISIQSKKETAGERLVAEKCDGCIELLKKQEIPACVTACKTGALVYSEDNRNNENRITDDKENEDNEQEDLSSALSLY